MSPTRGTRLDNGHVPQRAWDKLGCRHRMIQAVGREETGQREGKLGCGYGRNRCGKKTRNKPKYKQGRSKAKRIKEIRLQVERNQVVRKETQAVKEIRLQPCSGHDNWSCACKRTRSKEQCQSRVKGIGPWV